MDEAQIEAIVREEFAGSWTAFLTDAIAGAAWTPQTEPLTLREWTRDA